MFLFDVNAIEGYWWILIGELQSIIGQKHESFFQRRQQLADTLLNTWQWSKGFSTHTSFDWWLMNLGHRTLEQHITAVCKVFYRTMPLHNTYQLHITLGSKCETDCISNNDTSAYLAAHKRLWLYQNDACIQNYIQETI